MICSETFSEPLLTRWDTLEGRPRGNTYMRPDVCLNIDTRGEEADMHRSEAGQGAT